MTTRFEVGARVVCPDPTGRWFVGVVTHVHRCGDLTVTDGAGFFRASAGDVRPVMPRDRDDLDRYGRWWWVGNDVLCVIEHIDGGLRAAAPWDQFGDEPWPDDWRGPVQPPPEVRS